MDDQLSRAYAAECSASVDIPTSDTCDVGGQEADAVSVKVSAGTVRRKLAAGKRPLEAIRRLIGPLGQCDGEGGSRRREGLVRTLVLSLHCSTEPSPRGSALTAGSLIESSRAVMTSGRMLR